MKKFCSSLLIFFLACLSLFADAITVIPPGADTQIIFNDAGFWGADQYLTWNKLTKVLTTRNFKILDNVNQSHGLSWIVNGDWTTNHTLSYNGEFDLSITLTGDVNMTMPSGTFSVATNVPAAQAALFDGQLATTDDTLPEIAQKVDDLSVGAGSGDITSVGNVASGAAFDGTQGTVFTFDDPEGDMTIQTNATANTLQFSHPVDLGASGVRVSTDGDGAINYKSLGDGFQEDWNLNLDDTSNQITASSTTGATVFRFTGMGVIASSYTSGVAADPADAGYQRMGNAEVLAWEASPTGTDVTLGINTSEQFVLSSGINVTGSGIFSGDVTVPTEAYSAAGWAGDLSVPTKDAVQAKIETILPSFNTPSGYLTTDKLVTLGVPIGGNVDVRLDAGSGLGVYMQPTGSASDIDLSFRSKGTAGILQFFNSTFTEGLGATGSTYPGGPGLAAGAGLHFFVGGTAYKVTTAGMELINDANAAAQRATLGALSATPPGSDTQVIFNDGGVYGADADLTWNKVTNVLSFPSMQTATLTTQNFKVLDSVDQSHGLSWVVNGDWSSNKTLSYTGEFNLGITLTGDVNMTMPAGTFSVATNPTAAQASGYNGNLSPTDDTLPEIAQKLDDLTTGAAALPLGYLSGLTLSNNAVDVVNDIDVAVGICRDATNAQDIMLSGLTKRLDATFVAGTNQGGLDTGAVANNTYHVWAIKRTDLSATDVLFSLSPSTPTMPSGYTYKRRIGSIMRAGGIILAFRQIGNMFQLQTPVLDVDGTVGLTSSNFILGSVPTGIKNIAVFNALASSTTVGTAVNIRDPDTTDLAPSSAIAPLSNLRTEVASQFAVARLEVFTNTSSQISARSNVAGTAFRISTQGWIDNRDIDATTGGIVSAVSPVKLDLADDGADESLDLKEIAIINDTGGVVTEPLPDKMLFDFSKILSTLTNGYIFLDTPMASLVVDTAKLSNTKSTAVDATLTLSATPATGQVFGADITNSAATPVTITMWASNVAEFGGASKTTFIIPASSTVYGLRWQYKGSGVYLMSGYPTRIIDLAAASITSADSIQFYDATDGLPKRESVSNVETLFRNNSLESFIVACSDETTALTTGTGKVTFRMPYPFTLTDVRASVTTAPTGADIIADLKEAGVTVITANSLNIDATEKTSTTSSPTVTVTDTSLANDAEMTVDLTQVGSTVAGTGLKITLIGHR